MMNAQQKTNAILEKAVRKNEVSRFWYNEFAKSENRAHLEYAMNAYQEALCYLDCWSIMTDIEFDPCELDKFSSKDFEAVCPF